MKTHYTVLFFFLLSAEWAMSQSCTDFKATYSSTESRCASTGSITITATGGSGNYSYKILEPMATPLTSSATISGLAPGTYTVYTKDMETGCTLVQDHIVVTGSYSDPRFQLTKTDLTCTGGSNGTISLSTMQYGRAPFTYTIIAPSPALVGTTNTTGSFSGLPAGEYYVQLRDSCGGVQTRSISILDYTWSITNGAVTKINCTTVSVNIQLMDNKGNTNASGTAFNGFQYGVVNNAGDTAWGSNAAFNVSRTPLRSLTLVIKDRCEMVKSFNWQNTVPSADAAVTLSSYACNTFTARITSPLNLTSPQYRLKQGASTIQTNTTGQFNNVTYGAYCIEVYDACYDTVISRCFNVAKPTPAVGAAVSISNRQCDRFTATVTGQTNLFNPRYYLYNAANTEISDNTTGVFNNIPYGSYTIRIVSVAPCYDTTIVRAFTEAKPKPSVAAVPTYTNRTCSNYDAAITGATNLFSPRYYLYLNGQQVRSSPNGSFTNLSYGENYCIRIVSEAPCYDTTIERCFTQAQPQPAAANPVITNRTCNSFSVSIPSVTNIPDPQYCLFTATNTPLGCNATGQFHNLAYGNYYIDITTTSTNTACPATSVRRSFNVTRLAPGIDAAVSITNKVCTGFTATVTNQANLINPQFRLYDQADNLISQNGTGVFNNLAYGSYKIVLTNGCGEVINRTFNVTPTPLSFSLEASESCSINTTNVKVSVTSGQAPYLAKVLNPVNNVVATQTFSTSNYTFVSLPALAGSLQYKVAVTTACNQTDTVWVTPKASVFSRTSTVSSKCPSGQSESGSGALSIDLASNIGFFAPVIIKKDAVAFSKSPTTITTVSSSVVRYNFIDLAPGTYVLEYNISTCSQKLNDTVEVQAYRFPDLNNSAAYQCDNNNFSVSAAASGGVAPFSYEIIGASSPGLTMAPQTDPVFHINTNSAYTLVRMRAIDACGNGTLNDVSVLPLGQLTITSNNIDCYTNNITLSVDTIPNATYTWYRKTSATDSTLLTSAQSYNIPYLLPADTGTYVCVTSVNTGCLTRISYYAIHGTCSRLLPVTIVNFSGKLTEDIVPLSWTAKEEPGIKEYAVERRNEKGAFEQIGVVRAKNHSAEAQYSFIDAAPLSGQSKYRLKIVAMDGKITYSQIISIVNAGIVIATAPNPVKNMVTVSINGKTEAAYKISLVNLSGQTLYQQQVPKTASTRVPIQRNTKMQPGMYVLQIMNMETGETLSRKLIFD